MIEDFELSGQELNEIKKLYPRLKIPIEKYYKYYLNTLCQDKKFKVEQIITDVKDLSHQLSSTEMTLSNYRYSNSDHVLDYFNTQKYLEVINNYDKSLFFPYPKQSFDQWSEDKIYISVDLKEANWSVFKKYSESGITKSWKHFLTDQFNTHSLLSESKQYRQILLGLTSPKRLVKFQEHEMQNLINILNNEFWNLKFSAKTSDEIIIEYILDKETVTGDILIQIKNNKDIQDILSTLNNLTIPGIEFHYKLFTLSFHQNFNEKVKIKTFFDSDLNQTHKELFGTQGDRFYMHFKTLILNQELRDEDLYYIKDGYFSKWIVTEI